MAMYDEMGNYTGYDDAGFTAQPVAPSYDSFGAEVLNDEAQRKKEEELKRQMEEYARQQSELASQVSHKQEVTTYADGSRTVKTTNEIPSAASRPMPAPVAPQGFDQAAYNASIQQQESGANPNIGYHNKAASSAYGPYGITQGAWQDARRANPNLPQDITQATPEQMQAAQNAVTNNNARYLANYGVEVTPQTLQAAHFLGAKGLSDYLKTGYISPAAAAANGGEANVRRIVDQRLGGQAAAASGAAQAQRPVAPAEPTVEQPTAQPADQYSLATGTSGLGLKAEQPAATVSSQPYIEQYQTAQDNPEALMKLGLDETAPAWMRDRARNRAADLITQNREMEAAKQKLATASETDLARYLREKTTGGSWLKAVFFAAIGAKQLAQEEGAKLGIGTEKVVMGADGKPAIVKISSNGTPLSGYNAETGAKLTPEELVNAVAGGQAQKGVHQAADTYADPTGKIKGNFVLETRPGQAPVFKEVGSGRVASAAEGAVLRKIGVTGTLEDQLARQRQKLMTDLQFVEPTKRMEFAARFDQENGTNFAAELRNQMPGMFGGRVSPANATAPVVAPQAAPMAAPAAAPSATGPVAPTGNIPAGPVAPGQAMPRPAAGQTPADIMSQRKQEEERRKAGLEVNVDQQKRFNEYVEKDVQPKADAGKLISRVRKEQINGPDGILNNPEIAGMLQGGQGSEVGNILRDLITGNFKDQADLTTRVASLNLTPRQKEVLYTQIGLNNQILPQTLKANAGPGAISEAEHKINREANVEITRQPLYSGLSLMTRDQFQKDLAVAKNDFRSANQNIRTTDDLNKAWSSQERAANEAYDRIYAARAAYIAKHNPNGSNPGAVVDAFRHYPVPSWNGSSWEYGTEYAKKAARPPLNSFNR